MTIINLIDQSILQSFIILLINIYKVVERTK